MDKGYKVLIADDEHRICQLINKLIDWDNLDIQLAGIVHNGNDARDFIMSEKPDIVITDIKMPLLTGLELIDEVRQANLKTSFIMMSGYKQFEYAHKALKYGVEDYLLKPVNQKELNETLKNVVDTLSREEHQQVEKKELEQVAQVAKEKLQQECLDNLIDTTYKETTREQINDKYRVHLQEGIYQALLIKIDYKQLDDLKEEQDNLVIKKVVTMVEEMFQELMEEYILSVKNRLFIHCVINYDASRQKEVKAAINQLLIQAQNYLYAFGEYEITIGVGSEEGQFENIHYSIKTARKNIENRIVAGIGRLIYSNTEDAKSGFTEEKIVDKHRAKWLHVIDSYAYEQMPYLIHDVFGEMAQMKNIDGFLYYKVAKELVDLFIERVDASEEEKAIFTRKLNDQIVHCYRPRMLDELLIKEMVNCLECLSKQKQNEEYRPIRVAKEYVESNYEKKLVLDDVASMVGLNAVYFSTLFKKETGVNFSNYLTEIRVEAAKDLLRASDETVAGIAAKVGYKDSRYFSQTFSKIVGIKPAIYRKLYS